MLMLQSVTATVQSRHNAILSYTQQHVEDVRWANQPSPEEISDSAAANLPGGARATLKCNADESGRLTNCEAMVAEPDLPKVKTSALMLSHRYRLGQNDIEKVKWSKTPAEISLVIYFPDHNGRVPNDCHPAFGCVIEHAAPPPPPPPSPRR